MVATALLYACPVPIGSLPSDAWIAVSSGPRIAGAFACVLALSVSVAFVSNNDAMQEVEPTPDCDD